MNYKELLLQAQTNTLEKGFYKDIPSTVYHSNVPGLSSSGIAQLSITPAHFKAEVLDAPFDSVANDGALIHAMILDPDNLANEYRLVARRTKAEKDKAEAENKKLVIQSQIDKAAPIVDALKASPKALELLCGGENEISGFVDHPSLGFRMKIRPDSYHADKNLIIDLKTVGKEQKSGFGLEKLCLKRGWFTQAAYYCYVAELITGKPHQFMHVYVETEAPYGIRYRMINPAGMEKVMQDMFPLMKQYAKCLATNEWPGFSEETEELHLPTWGLSDAIDTIEEGIEDGIHKGFGVN